MARTKGAKNRSTIIAEELIAGGMDPKEARDKARMQVAREGKLAKKSAPDSTTTKKRSTKKTTKKTIEVPDQVSSCSPIAVNAWKKSQTGKSRKNAIRAMCLLCVGGSPKEVSDCTSTWCPLYQFRTTG